MKALPPGVVFPSILGHQGGWDEILLVGAPLAVVGVALWMANRRAQAQIEEAREAWPDPDADADADADA